MGLLFFIFTSTIVLSSVTLYIGISLGNKSQFYRVMHFFLAYAIFHVIHAALGRLLPPEYQFLDRVSPFGLLYGPILYFMYLTSSGHILKRKTVLIHSIPLMLGITYYIFFLITQTSRSRTHSLIYYTLLYGPMALSMLGYSVYVAYRGSMKKEKVKTDKRDIPSIAVIILFALSFFLILSVLKRVFVKIPIVATTTSLIVFGGLLGGVIIVFLISIQHLKEKLNAKESQQDLKEKETPIASAYMKSGLQDEEIREYVIRIDNYLSSSEYLDPNFNLSVLSSNLKIPKHHLSQLFSQHYGKSFLRYINGLRIEYACEILKTKEYDIIIEELAEECGFKSTVSFYRNFREIIEMTPSEYRESLECNIK